MTGIITVTEDQDWQAWNWAYHCLMDQVLELVTSDERVANFVETAKWNHGLEIPEMVREEPELAEIVLCALKRVAQSCSAGQIPAKVEGRLLDEEHQQRFRQVTHELATMLSELQ
jgi:hypothetical protein